MITAKADNRRRVQIPNIQAGQIFAVENHGNGIIVLHEVKPVEPRPGKVKFVKENGYTVGITDRVVSEATIRELLNDLP